MKLIFIFALLLTSPLFAEKKHNLSKKGLAIKGYDPVSYHTNTGPQKGSSDLKFSFNSSTYYFSSQENLNLFKADSTKYVPKLGGWCAFAMLEGKEVQINPKSYKIIEGGLYLFYDGLWGDTLKKWNALISKDQLESDLISKVQGNWQK